MTAHDPALVEKVAQSLTDEGAAPGNSIHSWRCEYPDRYGSCDCVKETAVTVLDAIADDLRQQGYDRAAADVKAAIVRLDSLSFAQVSGILGDLDYTVADDQ